MNRRVALILCLLVLAVSPSLVYAEDDGSSGQLGQSVEDELQLVDWTGLEEYAEQLGDNNSLLSEGGILQTVKSILDGNFPQAESFLEFLWNVFSQKFLSCLPQLVTILVVSILCGIVTRSKDTLISRSTNELIFFVCYGIVIIAVISSVWSLISSTKETLLNIKSLINLTLPLLITFMGAIGGKISASVYRPSVALLSGSVIEIIVNVVLPCAILAIVFTVVSNLSNGIKLTKLSQFFKNISVGVIGIVFTVFSAFLTVEGITAGAMDSVSIRAAKFATRNYIPILGGYLAEGFDLIMASSVLIKNALGVVALILLLSVVLSPLIQILTFNVGLQLISAAIEPLTDSRIVAFVGETGKNLTVFLVSILAVAFMLMILIMLVISTANAV